MSAPSLHRESTDSLIVLRVKFSNSLNDGTHINAKSLLKILKKLGIQLRFEHTTCIRHSHHWATGSLVAEECWMDVNILRIEFKHRQWLGYTGKAHMHSNSALQVRIGLPPATHLQAIPFLSQSFNILLFYSHSVIVSYAYQLQRNSDIMTKSPKRCVGYP